MLLWGHDTSPSTLWQTRAKSVGFPSAGHFAQASPNSSNSAKGYFVFPPSGYPPPASQTLPAPAKDAKSIPSHDHDATEDAYEEHLRRMEAVRKEQLKRETEVATAGEFDWVRSGGVLRDAHGRRDKVRTEQIAQEIRLQAKEQLALERWADYELRWRNVLSSSGPVTFRDMPWPQTPPPVTTRDLVDAKIREFLLASLAVRTNTVKKKDRLRMSMLRWHPDKMSQLLDRIVDEDADAVRTGVSAVFNACHNALQELDS